MSRIILEELDRLPHIKGNFQNSLLFWARASYHGYTSDKLDGAITIEKVSKKDFDVILSSGTVTGFSFMHGEDKVVVNDTEEAKLRLTARLKAMAKKTGIPFSPEDVKFKKNKCDALMFGKLPTLTAVFKAPKINDGEDLLHRIVECTKEEILDLKIQTDTDGACRRGYTVLRHFNVTGNKMEAFVPSREG